LILYPLYLDPVSRLPCDALTFVDRLEALRRMGAGAAGRPRRIPALRYLAALRQSLWPAFAPPY
jgi:hypothetical protein